MMFRILVILFILVPIVEIAVFIQVGDILGLSTTLLIVLITAVLGVNLLKQQGVKAWQDIQKSIAEGKMPAIEMASAAQLLFAGGLLLTPGFVTDIVGFLLMVPQIRIIIAEKIIKRGIVRTVPEHFNFTNQHSDKSHNGFRSSQKSGRTIEGEFEEKD